MALHPKLVQIKPALTKLGLIILVTVSWTLILRAQDSTQAQAQPRHSEAPKAAETAPDARPLDNRPSDNHPGTISGTVVDQSGAVLPGAEVKLIEAQPIEVMPIENPPSSNPPTSNQPAANRPAANRKVRSGSDGQFSFSNVSPGPFQLMVTSAGFSPQTISGTLDSGQSDRMPPIMMAVATRVTEINVGLTREEIAEEAEAELKIEEKQRVLGAIPNFYVTYNPNAAPLNAKQKFKLAAKNVIDPFTFVIVGGTAGVQQAQNHFRGYGQGTQGYAQRFAANYGDTLSGTFIGGAILPALLKQDPRYFYKGTGTLRFRALYAIANAVICKGDNRRWQPNYSNILGSIAAGGISNIYYPPQDRDGTTLTFENAAIGIGTSAIYDLMQEFVVRHFTPKLPRQDPPNPEITHN